MGGCRVAKCACNCIELNEFNSERRRRRSEFGSSAPRTCFHFLNGADAVQNSELPLSSSIVDNYYILGGQHLAYVVVAFREEAIVENLDLEELDVEPDDRRNEWMVWADAEVCLSCRTDHACRAFLPVSAVQFTPPFPQVLRPETPIHIRRLAAGAHNRAQSNAKPPAIADMALFIKYTTKALGMPPGTGLSDATVWCTLKESGIPLTVNPPSATKGKKDSTKLEKKQAKAADKAKTHDLDDEAVCPLYLALCSSDVLSGCCISVSPSSFQPLFLPSNRR